MKSKTKLSFKDYLYNFSTLFILLVVTLLFAIFGNNFLRMGNIGNIINQASFLAIIGIAQLVVILTGGVNLSIGSTMALATVLCGKMMLAESNIFFLIPIFLIIIFGGIIGAINGFLITKLDIPAFLATFAVMYVARGAAWLYIGRGVYYGINENIRSLAMGELFHIGDLRFTVPMFIALVFIVFMSFFLTRTTIGRKIYFTGANPIAARFAGIPDEKIIVFAHILSGLISGLAGILYVARINAADANLGVTYHFDAISVALIGGAVMSGGAGSVWGTAVGALIISVIQSGMNNLQIPTELQTAFLGVIIIAAVFFNSYIQNKKIRIQDDSIEENTEETVNQYSV